MPRLSKSRLMSSLQCQRKLYLETHRRDLIEHSKSTEAIFAMGHEVGDKAIQLYGNGRGTYIEYSGGNFAPELAKTRELMDGPTHEPIFEAIIRGFFTLSFITILK